MSIWGNLIGGYLGFSIAGPDVCFKLTPNSLAITWASVVLPNPGGPKIKT